MFHKRNMLMSSCVDYDIRPISLKDSCEAFLVGNRDDLYREIKFIAILHLQFLLNVIGRVLVDIENDQFLRIHSGYLPTEL